MTQVEKTLIRQHWYSAIKLYPGFIWYREAGANPAWFAEDKVILAVNTDYFDGDNIPSEIHVVVDWTVEAPPKTTA